MSTTMFLCKTMSFISGPSFFFFFFLYQVTKECLDLAISVCKHGVPFKKIGKKIRFVVYVQVLFFPSLGTVMLQCFQKEF